MSYISAPKLHQSTALLWPLLIRISGALKHDRPVTEEGARPAAVTPQSGGLHVLDGPAEGVSDRSVVNRLFAQAEVGQLDVSCGRRAALQLHDRAGELGVCDVHRHERAPWLLSMMFSGFRSR